MAEEFKQKSSIEVYDFLLESGIPDVTCHEFEGKLLASQASELFRVCVLVLEYGKHICVVHALYYDCCLDTHLLMRGLQTPTKQMV